MAGSWSIRAIVARLGAYLHVFDVVDWPMNHQRLTNK
jgi:hypothetical protein